jgi:hypothetical protein
VLRCATACGARKNFFFLLTQCLPLQRASAPRKRNRARLFRPSSVEKRHAEKSLSKEDREKMKNWQGAGLYGPISGVFGRLEDKYQLDIMRTRNMQPNVEQGKNIFSSNWQWVHNKICNEWNFCKRKKEFADENKLLISIIALVLAGTSWHLRTATAVILLAWHQGPKFMCDCPDEKGESTTPQASES